MEIAKDQGTLAGVRLVLDPGRDAGLHHFGEFLSSERHVVPPHAHTFWELLLQVRGQTTWQDARGSDLTVEAGSLLLAPPGLRHWMAGPAPAAFRIYFVGTPAPTRLDDAFPADRLTMLRHADHLQSLFHEMQRELLVRDAEFSEAVANLWRVMEIAVLRLERTQRRDYPDLERMVFLNRVCSFVEADPGRRWTLRAVGELMGLSANHFGVRFKAMTGQTFHQYLIDTRLAAAREAIRANQWSLTRIALELGFGSSQHFSRAFRHRYGETARDFRRRCAAS